MVYSKNLNACFRLNKDKCNPVTVSYSWRDHAHMNRLTKGQLHTLDKFHVTSRFDVFYINTIFAVQ